MPSRLIVRSIMFLAALVGVSASAHAGIIVTVGKPCPEIIIDARKPTSDGAQRSMQETGGEIRCVVMPDGTTRCGKTMRVESVSLLPTDWRCTQVTRSVLYCETPPGFGAAPGAAGEGEFDAQEDDYLDDEEIQTLGCSGGAGVGGLTGIGGVLVLLALRRRRNA